MKRLGQSRQGGLDQSRVEQNSDHDEDYDVRPYNGARPDPTVADAGKERIQRGHWRVREESLARSPAATYVQLPVGPGRRAWGEAQGRRVSVWCWAWRGMAVAQQGQQSGNRADARQERTRISWHFLAPSVFRCL